MFSWDKCQPELAKWLSTKLDTTVAYFWDEDTSGWFGYSVFKRGEELECFQYGANYEDELEEFSDKPAENLPAVEAKRDEWDTFCSDEGIDYQFSSKLTKAADDDLKGGLEFVDKRFNAIGICVPETFPEKQEAIRFRLNA